MSQVLQDVADMAIDFKRAHGYSLATFEVQYVSSANSSSFFQDQQADYKKHTTTINSTGKNPNVGIARENTTKRTVQQPPSQVPPQSTNLPRKSSVT